MSAALPPAITVLLADDSNVLRDLLRDLLESMRMEVLEASSGADSILIAASYPGKIHLLLTDIDMEGSSGWESALTISALRPDIRVIYMSGGVSFPDWNAAKGKPAGSYFLEKPFGSENLKAILTDIFPSSYHSQGALAQCDHHE